MARDFAPIMGGIQVRNNKTCTTFLARYTFSGARCVKTFPTREQALEWLASEHRLIAYGEWVHPKLRGAGGGPLQPVGDWAREWFFELKPKVELIRETSAIQAQKVITSRLLDPVGAGAGDEFFARLCATPIADVTPGILQRYVDRLALVYPDTWETNRKAVIRVKELFDRAFRRGLLVSNPAAGLMVPPARAAQKRLPREDELHAIIECLPAPYRLIGVLTLFHGLRLGEALALTVDDLDLGGGAGVIHVRSNLVRVRGEMIIQPPKTRAGYRDVPLLAAFYSEAVRHMGTYPPLWVQPRGAERVKGFIFSSPQRRLVTDVGYRSALARAREVAGVEAVITPHMGRNWLITRLAEQGAHVKEIGALLGQDDVETIVGTYLKVREGRVGELMGKVSHTLGTPAPGSTQTGESGLSGT